MVASTMAYSMSGWSETASKSCLKSIRFHPVSIPLEDRVPSAKRRQQVAPRTAGSGDPQHRFDKGTVILAPTGVGFSQAMPFHFRPPAIAQHISVHPKLQSQI